MTFGVRGGHLELKVPILGTQKEVIVAHEREIAEEQLFLDIALKALDHMRDEARSLRDSAAVANMRGAGDLVERDVVMARRSTGWTSWRSVTSRSSSDVSITPQQPGPVRHLPRRTAGGFR